MTNGNGNGKFQTLFYNIVQTAIILWIPGSIWWAAQISSDINHLKEEVTEIKAQIRLMPDGNKERVEALKKRVEKLEDDFYRAHLGK